MYIYSPIYVVDTSVSLLERPICLEITVIMTLTCLKSIALYFVHNLANFWKKVKHFLLHS